MFNKGEIVFYKNIGVCKVTDITSLDFAMDKDQKYYVMESIFKNGVNYVPVDQEYENIRNIISKEEAEEMVMSIKELQAKPILDMATREMSSKYEEMVNSTDPYDILKLTLSIDKKKEIVQDERKKFGAIDDNYLKKAKDMLFEELAAALNIDKFEVSKYIKEKTGYEFVD